MRNKTRCHAFAPMLLLIGCFFMITTNAALAAENVQSNMDYEAGFYYTVKKGDTLWDLSQRFSDSPWQWPDLWRENTQLTNPHWIYPGERIRLFRKTGIHQDQGEATKQVPTLAPQVEASQAVEEQPLQVDFVLPGIDRVGFIRTPPVIPEAIIFKSLDNKKLISKDDIVYIRAGTEGGKNDFIPGSRYTVYRNLDPLTGKLSTAAGNQHLFSGIIEITKNNTEYAMAKVIEQFDAIRINDKLMPYEPRQPIIPVIESTPGIQGHIIAAENHSTLLGDLAIAFIDKGSQDNIQIGQVYNIYYQETATQNTGGKPITLDPVDIGTLFVLHIEKETSTVILTSSSRKITPGQPIRTP